MTVRILQGDCRAVMATLDEASVDAIVTDPPYELGFMGKGWDATGVANDIETWRQALRVLKPGGHLLAFSGTRTYHRMVCAIEDAGFEVRDQIGWLYGSGFPKSLDVSKAIDKAGGSSPVEQSRILRTRREAAALSREQVAERVGCTPSSVRDWEEGRARAAGAAAEFIVPSEKYRAKLADLLGYSADEREVVGVGGGARGLYETGHRGIAYGDPKTDAARQWQGWGTALKPAWEPIVLARKPLAGTVAANVLEHGTGALNIEGCRVGDTVETWPKSRSFRSGISSGYTEGIEKGATQSTGAVPAGRWPANVMHDGSDEVLAAFPHTTSGKQAAGGHVRNGDKTRSTFGAFAGQRVEGDVLYGDSGSAARFFYTAKASAHDRHDGLGHPGPQFEAGRTPRDAENVERQKRGNHHPTVKPTDLMRYLCRLVTPPGGLVLDPFAGSGSTLKAAELEGFRAIGIELDPAYIEIARRRIASDAPLFAEVAA